MSEHVAEELVRDHIPLEQGLRRPFTLDPEKVEEVRDHIPLEQGLRLFSKRVEV